MKKEREQKTEYGTISLPMPLINKIKDKIKGTGMNSVSSYISFVLRQILSSPYEKIDENLNKATEKEIKRRLKELGYI
ncbi:CopG family transcriptional regulator [Candidatus Pacearchaeota archaeon]|nr:CopG family transcriptional regulator [Candidatus Pacearchaeota archaeon]